MDASSDARKVSNVARSGRGAPLGGIRPARSLRITFSQVSASRAAWAASTFSSVRPPVCSLSLWQVRQYLFTRSCWEAGCWAVSTAVKMANPQTVKSVFIDQISSGTRARARDYIFGTTFQCGTMFVPNVVAGFSPRSILRLAASQFLQQTNGTGFSNGRLAGEENAFREGHRCASLFVFDVELCAVRCQQFDHRVEATVGSAVHGRKPLRVDCVYIAAPFEA